jgi:two-component system nitrogen regulation response regulator GlnG
VRELRNAIEHAIIVARGGHIMPELFPPSMPASYVAQTAQDIEAAIQELLIQWTAIRLQDPDGAGRIYQQLLELVEPSVLRAIVQDQKGQVAASARIMGLHRTTLRKKLDQYGLDVQ